MCGAAAAVRSRTASSACARSRDDQPGDEQQQHHEACRQGGAEGIGDDNGPQHTHPPALYRLPVDRYVARRFRRALQGPQGGKPAAQVVRPVVVRAVPLELGAVARDLLGQPFPKLLSLVVAAVEAQAGGHAIRLRSEIPNALGERPVKRVEMSGKPLVPPLPVRLVGRIHIARIVRYSAITGSRVLIPPRQRIAQLFLDSLFLPFQESEVPLSVLAGDVQFHADIFLPSVHDGGQMKAADAVTAEGWRVTIDLNLVAPFFLARALVPAMRQKGWGRIVNLASLQSARVFPSELAYGASKGASPGSPARWRKPGRATGRHWSTPDLRQETLAL